MQAAALALVIAAGAWLAGVGALMALHPRLCLALCKRLKAALERSSKRVQWSEQGLRVLVGVAEIVRAPASKLPLLFELMGWALVLSSLAILALPIRWHATLGGWWIERASPLAIRLLAPVPLAVGIGLAYLAI